MYLAATTGSFAVRNELKEDGFSYDSKKKIWTKECSKEDAERYRQKYATVVFKWIC